MSVTKRFFGLQNNIPLAREKLLRDVDETIRTGRICSHIPLDGITRETIRKIGMIQRESIEQDITADVRSSGKSTMFHGALVTASSIATAKLYGKYPEASFALGVYTAVAGYYLTQSIAILYGKAKEYVNFVVKKGPK